MVSSAPLRDCWLALGDLNRALKSEQTKPTSMNLEAQQRESIAFDGIGLVAPV